MDPSREHPPSEDSYVDVTEPSKAATPPFAGTPATPLKSRSGKEKLQLPTGVHPGQMRCFTRVTDVIYGPVSTHGHLAPSLDQLPEIILPPLHPRTLSMMDSRCTNVDMTRPSKPKHPPKRAQSLTKNHAKSSTLPLPPSKPARTLSEQTDTQTVLMTSSIATKPGIQVLGKGSHNHKTPLTRTQTVPPVASKDDMCKVPVTNIGGLNQLLPEEELSNTRLSSADSREAFQDSHLQPNGRGYLDKLLPAKMHSTTAIKTTCSEALLAQQNPSIVLQDSFSQATEWSSFRREEGSPLFTPADRSGDNVCEDTIVAEMQKQKLAESQKEDPIILGTPQIHTPCKPGLPGKSTDADTQSKVIKMHHLRKKIEEIHDSTNILKNSECIGLPDCVVMVTKIEDDYKKMHGVEPTEENSKFLKPDASDGDSTDYEGLVIYEDFKDDEYQDTEKARAEALELPKSIRHRVVRIVKGPERRRLRRKVKSHHSGTPQVVVTDFDDTATPPWKGNSVLEPAHTPESSSDEDDMHDGYMSHDKARQVLDMLLEANNVRKPADRGSQSVQEHKLRRKNSDTESSLDIVVLPPEVTEYQKGTKSQSEEVAEIRLLTASAPKEPPPLLGIQRSRTRVVAQSDDVARRRKMLQKTKTFPQYDNTAQTKD